MKKLKPWLHRVLLKMENLDEVDETFKAIKAAGLQIPPHLLEKEKNAVVWAKVVDVGSTAFKEFGGQPYDLAIGDTVLIAKYSGKTFKFEGEEFTLVNDEDIVGVVKDD